MADVAGLTDAAVEQLRRDLTRQVERTRRDLARAIRAIPQGASQRVRLETARRIGEEIADLLARNFGAASPAFRRASAVIADELTEDFGELGLSDAFTTQALGSIRAQVDGTLQGIAETITTSASELRTAIVDTVRSGVPPTVAIRDLERAMQTSAAHVVTAFDTGLASFDRSVMTQVASDAGVEWFVYDGPSDDLTRPYCRARVGFRFTLSQLNATPNDTGPNPPATFCGGYNCRHRLTPLVSQASVDEVPAWQG